MNINREINKLQKRMAKKIEDMVLHNLDEINEQAYEYYTPILEEMQQIVDEVYGNIYMDIDTYEQYSNKFVEVSKPFAERDGYMLSITEEVVRRNKIVLTNSLNELVAYLRRLPITEQRIKLEYRKCRNSAVAKMTRFLNINYKELNREFNGIIEYCHDSLIDYGMSSRVIDNIDMIEEVIDIDNEDVDLIKITELDEMIDFVESYGYSRVRQCGSHAIYKNKKGYITVIPIHSGNKIDKGLAYSVQKEVLKHQGVIK